MKYIARLWGVDDAPLARGVHPKPSTLHPKTNPKPCTLRFRAEGLGFRA